MRPPQERTGKDRARAGNNQKQLANEAFLAKAPAKVVEGLRTAAKNSVLQEKANSKLKELGC